MPIRQATRKIEAPVSRRKQRYKSDASYRENAKAMSRKSYRSRAHMELKSCLYSLEFLASAGAIRQVKLPNGKMREMHTFSLPEAAKVLQKLYQTVWRWCDCGMIPKPCLLTAVDTAKPYTVYHINEVRALIEIIGEHEKNVAYFRKDHVAIREAIERRISDIRKTLFK